MRRQARRRGGHDLATLFDTEFLAVADQIALHQAILTAALTVADSCDLQLLQSDKLHMTAHHGFGPAFLDYFATVDETSPTACGRALAARRPILVDDVARSPIFAGQSTLEAMLDAGSRAVASYPLCGADGTVLGVLSLHHRRHGPTHDAAEHVLIRGTVLALTAASVRACG